MPTLAFNLALLLDRLALLTPACLYLLGVAVLAWKVFPAPGWLDLRQVFLCGAVLWIAAVAGDFILQLRRPFTVEYARAWLDWKNEAGGEILSGVGSTPRRVKPTITVLPFFRSLILPGLFVAAALLVPEWRPETRLSGAGLGHQITALENELAEKRDELSPPDAEQLERQLEQLRELAERNPEAAAEALSALEKRLEEAESMRLNRLAEALERAAELRDDMNLAAAGGAGDAASGEARAEKAEQLREALEQLIAGEGGLQNMPESFRQAWEQMAEGADGSSSTSGERSDDNANGTMGERDPAETGRFGQASRSGAMGEGQLGEEQMQRMLQALESMAGALDGNASPSSGDTGESGTETSARSGSASDAARDRLESAAAALERLQGGMAGVESVEPGEGGVDRGRGDAPLLFGRPSSHDDLGVEFAPLPRGDPGEADTLLRRERLRPDETLPPEEFRAPWRSVVDAPDTVRAGQGAAGLGPASRRAAEQYFERLQQER